MFWVALNNAPPLSSPHNHHSQQLYFGVIATHHGFIGLGGHHSPSSNDERAELVEEHTKLWYCGHHSLDHPHLASLVRAQMEPALIQHCLTLGLMETTACQGAMLWSLRHGGGEERSGIGLEWGVGRASKFWARFLAPAKKNSVILRPQTPLSYPSQNRICANWCDSKTALKSEWKKQQILF